MNRILRTASQSAPEPYIPHNLCDSEPGVHYRLNPIHAPGPVQIKFSSWKDAQSMARALLSAERWSFEIVRVKGAV
jgi:hypothetical protein